MTQSTTRQSSQQSHNKSHSLKYGLIVGTVATAFAFAVELRPRHTTALNQPPQTSEINKTSLKNSAVIGAFGFMVGALGGRRRKPKASSPKPN